ncbi:MAG: periplasmic binding protein/LacI transcriptional regulator [Bacillus sp. (in: firmicutes)]|jgi:ribose transport system substrate-binding protein|nr:periplasmic binding protein/LacI transcriptional regulator [Bacillus sp. (in: firmicutes)]
MYAKFFYTLGIFLCLILFIYSGYFAYKLEFHAEKQVKDKDKKTYLHHIVLVPEELDNDYWKLIERGAKKAAKESNVFLEYQGPKQANLEEHIKLIEMAAASKVDGIMMQGLSEELSTPLINKIMDKGIPVITVDTDAAQSNRVAYIGTDNYYSGFLAGKALIEGTGGKAKVGIVTGSFTAANQKLRVQGFRDAVEYNKGIKIIAIEESNITRVEAADKSFKLLKEHPEINAFFGTSALDGIGIVKAVDQLGLLNQMYIISFDALPETITYLDKGVIDATIVQEPYEMGYRAVKMMVQQLEGKEIPKVNLTETKVIHKEELPLIPGKS